MALTTVTLNIVLERLDPARNMARYYVLSVEPTLFGDSALVRRWGRLGCQGRARSEFFDDPAAACVPLDTWLARKRKRGYVLRARGAAEPNERPLPPRSSADVAEADTVVRNGHF